MTQGKTLILRDYGGQYQDVEIYVRENGSSYATFKSIPGLCIVKLAENLDEAGRDPVKLVRDAMLRETEDDDSLEE